MKLSEKQKEVIIKLRHGWLLFHRDIMSDICFMKYRGEHKNVNIKTFYSLSQKELIKRKHATYNLSQEFILTKAGKEIKL